MKIVVEREYGALVGRVSLAPPHKVILLDEKLLEVVAEEANASFESGEFYKVVRGQSYEELEKKAAKAQKRLRVAVERVLRIVQIVEAVMGKELKRLEEKIESLECSQKSQDA